MIKVVENKNKQLAIIIKAEYEAEGIKFFTPDSFSQQLAYMKRPKEYIIPPHVHNPVKRDVSLTQEVLYIKKGKVRVDFYDIDKIYLESTILEKGDVILLADGGHGFEMLQESEIIEVKQGPYVGEMDKLRFDPINKEEITIK